MIFASSVDCCPVNKPMRGWRLAKRTGPKEASSEGLVGVDAGDSGADMEMMMEIDHGESNRKKWKSQADTVAPINLDHNKYLDRNL